MKIRTAALLLQEDQLVTVHCVFFNSDNPYVYVCPRSVARCLSVDDWVVVESKNDKGMPFNMLQVTQIDNELDIDVEADHHYRMIVDRIDTTAFDATTRELDATVKGLQHALRAKRRQQAREAAKEHFALTYEESTNENDR